MKCIPECDYNVKPDNITVLNHHMQDCYINGAMKDITGDLGIVWRSGELHVAMTAEEGDIVMQGDLVVPFTKPATKKKKSAK